MVSERGEAHVVVHVQTGRGHVALRRVGLAVVGELGGALAQISVECGVDRLEPDGGELLLFAFCHGLHHRREDGEELAEVGQRVAVERAGFGHGRLGNHAVVLHAIYAVVERSTLTEVHVAV